MSEDGSTRSATGDPDAGSPQPAGVGDGSTDPLDRLVDGTDLFVKFVEIVAAGVFALLFAIGVVDLGLQIVGAVGSGSITDPLVVIGFIDTGLLLLIIVEVYQTVVAYTRENDTRRIVRLVIYTGVIAVVRKVIIFRTGEYGSPENALLVALAYTVITFGLVALLYVERTQAVEGNPV